MADVVEWLRGLDPRARAEQAERLVTLVTTGPLPSGSGLSALVEQLAAWTGSSNTRVVLGGLGALRAVCERKGDAMRLHVPEVLPLLRDLLTDTSDTVREQLLAVLGLCMAADRPGAVFDHLAPALSHRAARARQTALLAAELMFAQCAGAGPRGGGGGAGG
jgi:hypothetical protein